MYNSWRKKGSRDFIPGPMTLDIKNAWVTRVAQALTIAFLDDFFLGARKSHVFTANGNHEKSRYCRKGGCEASQNWGRRGRWQSILLVSFSRFVACMAVEPFWLADPDVRPLSIHSLFHQTLLVRVVFYPASIIDCHIKITLSLKTDGERFKWLELLCIRKFILPLEA